MPIKYSEAGQVIDIIDTIERKKEGILGEGKLQRESS